MTNSWDFPVYGALFALFLFFVTMKQSNNETMIKRILNAIKTTFVYGIVVLAISILISLPFSIGFNPMASGVAKVNAHTLWWQFLVLWGFFWFIALGFWLFLFIKSRAASERSSERSGRMNIVSRFARFLTAFETKDLTIIDIFILVSTVWATVLIIVPEFIYVKDIYIAEYHRANTMFKLVYESFMFYSIAAGYVLYRIKNSIPRKYLILTALYLTLFAIGFTVHMVYPYFAIKGYYGNLKEYKGLYGLNFLKRTYPDNFEAMNWLKDNVSGQPVIVEAAGDSYTYYNHFSALTGIPTIEGWLVHEWLWRGGYDKPGARATEVEKIYISKDDNEVQNILQKYKVKYIIFGAMERQKYKDINETRFAKLGKKVFESGETRIYEL
jgi:YYY domain-containing protein